MSSFGVVCSIIAYFTVSQAKVISRIYTAKLEFNNRRSDNELLGEYKVRLLCECSMMCQKNCGFFGYNGKLMRCRTHKTIFSSDMSDEAGWKYFSYNSLPTDCKDLRDNSYTKTGVYDIYPFGTSSHPVRVDCDMDTMDGGWTAIQKRIDGSVSFNRNWAEYKNGFGSPEQDVWIGNDIIHQLTKGKNSYLYVSITLVNGTKMYQLYDGFSVSDEAEKYKLFLMGSIKGTLGDSMVDTDFYGILSGMYFSTLDKDNDVFYGGLGNDNSGTSDNCALLLGGGWWFNACHQAFLNGPWSSPDWEQVWSPVIRYGTQVRGTMMLIKRH